MTLPSSSPTLATNADDVELLLQFVRERDVHCPRCDYNLRNLTRPVCPECKEQLRLTVGARRVRFGWLILALAPGIFSCIAAVLFAVPLTVFAILRPGTKGPPLTAYAMDGFGWLSAACAAVLYVQRYRFLKQRLGVQITWTIVTWLIHIGALVLFLHFLR